MTDEEKKTDKELLMLVCNNINRELNEIPIRAVPESVLSNLRDTMNEALARVDVLTEIVNGFFNAFDSNGVKVRLEDKKILIPGKDGPRFEDLHLSTESAHEQLRMMLKARG